ncbi:MAG: dTMP kinase [Nitrospirae bacterium]|nr:dTMP kinase [Nitrospirota bacterium]
MKITGGFFITLEGIEGCGKTTQSSMLVEYLEAEGYHVTKTREPGGTAVGGRIRAILLDPESRGITGTTELMLYSADRAQHMAEVIEPALAAGGIVVCDRFADATLAYQGYGRGLDADVIASLTDIATRGCKPDLTILFDLPVEQGLGRAIGRNDSTGAAHESRFEQEALAFHEKVRQGYLAIAACDRERVKVIDASGTIEEVWAVLREVVEAAVKGRG